MKELYWSYICSTASIERADTMMNPNSIGGRKRWCRLVDLQESRGHQDCLKDLSVPDSILPDYMSRHNVENGFNVYVLREDLATRRFMMRG
jgi:hypothetical protein